MGSWNATCMVTRLPIEYGDPVRGFLVTLSKEGANTYPSVPVSLPLIGTYDDYGALTYTGPKEVQECTEAFVAQKLSQVWTWESEFTGKKSPVADPKPLDLERILHLAERASCRDEEGFSLLLKEGEEAIRIGLVLVHEFVFNIAQEEIKFPEGYKGSYMSPYNEPVLSFLQGGLLETPTVELEKLVKDLLEASDQERETINKTLPEKLKKSLGYLSTLPEDRAKTLQDSYESLFKFEQYLVDTRNLWNADLAGGGSQRRQLWGHIKLFSESLKFATSRFCVECGDQDWLCEHLANKDPQ